jgi:hypothetical protein
MALVLLRNGAVDDARAEADEEEARTATLQQEVGSLQGASELADRVGQRRTTAESTLAGDIAWTRVVQEVATAMPNDVWLTALTANRDAAGGAATVTFTAKTFDQGSPGRWLNRLAELPSLQDVWVSNSTLEDDPSGRRVVTFTSDATLTESAGSDRAEQLPGEDS